MDIVTSIVKNYEIFYEIDDDKRDRVSSGIFKALTTTKDHKFILVNNSVAICSPTRIAQNETSNPEQFYAGHRDKNYIYPFEYVGQPPLELLWQKASKYLSHIERTKSPYGLDVGMLVSLKYKSEDRFADKYNYTVELQADSAIMRKLESGHCYVLLVAGVKILSIVYNINTGVQYLFDLYP